MIFILILVLQGECEKVITTLWWSRIFGIAEQSERTSIMKCPECESENTRKYSIVNEDVTSKGESEGSVDHSDFSVSHSRSEHSSQTELAKRCSPPDEPSPGFILSTIGIVFSVWFAFQVGDMMDSFWIGLVSFPVSTTMLYVFWSLVLARSSHRRHEEDMAEWEKTWICLKCGNSYIN